MDTQCTKRRRLAPVAGIVLFAVATLFASSAHAEPTTNATAPVRSNIPAYIGFGVGGASVVVGTIFGIVALAAKNDFVAHPTLEAADRAQTNALVADIAFGVAVASGLTAIVYLLSNPSRPIPARSGMLVAPMVSSGGGGIAAAVRF